MKRKLRQLKDSAQTMEQRRKYARAIELYRLIGRYEPDNPRWPQKVGEMYERDGERGKAAWAFYAAASRYAQLEFLNKALAMCERALAHDMSNPHVKELFVKLHAQVEQVGRAKTLPGTPAINVAPKAVPKRVNGHSHHRLTRFRSVERHERQSQLPEHDSHS